MRLVINTIAGLTNDTLLMLSLHLARLFKQSLCSWSIQGHSIVQWHLQQSPELLYSGCFPYLVCAALIQLKYSGSFNYPMTLGTIPGALVLEVFFLILVCAAFIQLKCSGSFNCPMTLATVPWALALGGGFHGLLCAFFNQLMYSTSFNFPMTHATIPEALVLVVFSLFGTCCLEPVEVLGVIQLSNDTCDSPWNSCPGSIFFSYLVCAALSQLKYSGSFNCPMTLATVPGTRPGGIFPYLVCAALSQLKYSGSFNCPMTLATVPGTIVLGVFFLIWYVLPWASWSILGYLIVQWPLQQSLDLLFWGYISLFWYVLPLSIWSIQGHLLVKWHLWQPLELMSWGYLPQMIHAVTTTINCNSPWSFCFGGIFPYLVCAAFIQLKYCCLFICPMALVITLQALALGMFSLNDICCDTRHQHAMLYTVFCSLPYSIFCRRSSLLWWAQVEHLHIAFDNTVTSSQPRRFN